MRRLNWVRAAETSPGEVLVVGLDPATGALAFVRDIRRAAPHLRLVAVTVADLKPDPRPGEPAWNTTYRLTILHEGCAYRVDVTSQTVFTVLDPHHPACADCGEVWPCREVRLERAATELITELEHTCTHCGEPIGGAQSETFHDGLTTRRYHTALRYRGPDGVRCRLALAAARASIPGTQP